jgi:hypothetical protein
MPDETVDEIRPFQALAKIVPVTEIQRWPLSPSIG